MYSKQMTISKVSILLGIDSQGSYFVLHHIILYSSFGLLIIYNVVVSM